MENFREMAGKFLEADAGIQVKDPEELARAWKGLLGDPARAQRMGAAARELVERNHGATSRVLTRIAGTLNSSRGRS